MTSYRECRTPLLYLLSGATPHIDIETQWKTKPTRALDTEKTDGQRKQRDTKRVLYGAGHKVTDEVEIEGVEGWYSGA